MMELHGTREFLAHPDPRVMLYAPPLSGGVEFPLAKNRTHPTVPSLPLALWQ